MATSPYPFFYSAPPAFPYAATYPYLHPASAYMTDTAFSPAPTYGPSTLPSTAASYPTVFGSFPSESSYPTHKGTISTQIPTHVDPNRLPPAPPPIHGDPHLFPLLHQHIHLPDSQVLQPPPEATVPSTFAAPTNSPNLFGAPTPVSFPAPAYDSSALTQEHLRPPHSMPSNAAMAGNTKHPQRQPVHIGNLQVPTTMQDAASVFGQMPTPRSGYGNYDYGHQKPIQNSCVQSVSSSSNWQNLDRMPQSYGFHNLNDQRVVLADGTEHSYFTLPADYPLEQATPRMSHSAAVSVSVAAPPSVAAQAVNRQSVYLADGTKHNYFTLLADYPLEQSTPPVSNSTAENVPTAIQDASSVFKEIAVYDVYEEDVTACRSCVRPAVYTTEIDTEEVEVKVDSGKPISSFQRPTDSIFSFANEKKSDVELLAVCFKNTSNNAFSEEATDVPRFFVEESIGCKTNSDTKLHSLPDSEVGNTIEQPATQLWNKLLPEAGRQEWDPGIVKPSFMDLCLRWQQDIKFNGIALWLMTFNPP